MTVIKLPIAEVARILNRMIGVILSGEDPNFVALRPLGFDYGVADDVIRYRPPDGGGSSDD